MPRSLINDPSNEVRRALAPLNMAEISRRTGISQSTLNKYRQRPDLLPLVRAIEIFKAADLKPDLFKGGNV